MRPIQHRPYQRLLHRQIAMDVLDFHRRIVHQNADCERQPAQRHHVDRVAHRFKMMSDVRIESGIEMQTISVLRQLPRNSRIIKPVRTAAIAASFTTPLIAARTNSD